MPILTEQIIYLQWRNLDPMSKERFAADLFGTLSSRWYPVNVIH